MLIVELPPLSAVKALDGTTFESVLHCHFISLSGQKRRFSQSQRQFLSVFNRSSQRAIGKHLEKAQAKGFITKIRQSTGTNPDEYTRGDFFALESLESRSLITLANSLWGTNGLLRTWPHPTAWGHGCLSPAVILILATLRVLDESISKKSLRRYLSPLVKESSFNSGVKFVAEHHLAYSDCGRLLIAPDWDAKVRAILVSNPACYNRQIRGDRRRHVESEKNRMRVARSELSDAERKRLLELPCVVKGCNRRRREMEHFPPMHFLKQLEVTTNRYFVWSICKQHNHEMQSFIKGMPNDKYIPASTLVLTPGVDPHRIYSAAANRAIIKFYEAFRNNDVTSATQIATAMIGLWKALNQQPQMTYSTKDSRLRTRELRGSKPYSPAQSQLNQQQYLV